VLTTHGKGRERPRVVFNVRVELLYWDGCPSVAEARALLADALAAKGITEPIVELEIVTHEDAVAAHFPGSPTIRIDGVDIDAAGADSRYALTCRIYRLEDGRISPVPSRQQLEEALQ
jgi:hypothetical protein